MTAEPEKEISSMYDFLKKVYHYLVGNSQKKSIFNFKYLPVYQMYPELKAELKKLEGDILDFGCGNKPYKDNFKRYEKYVGVDVYDSEGVDIVIDNKKIPLEDNSFDVVLATQVFEHTDSLSYMSELYRVLKPGGVLIFTVPFLYHVHEDYDYRRFTTQGVEALMKKNGFIIEKIKKHGAIGSTITILFTHFVDASYRDHANDFAKIILLPFFVVWLLIFIPVLNIFALLVDKIDKTGRFYNNIFLVANKK